MALCRVCGGSGDRLGIRVLCSKECRSVWLAEQQLVADRRVQVVGPRKGHNPSLGDRLWLLEQLVTLGASRIHVDQSASGRWAGHAVASFGLPVIYDTERAPDAWVVLAGATMGLFDSGKPVVRQVPSEWVRDGLIQL